MFGSSLRVFWFNVTTHCHQQCASAHFANSASPSVLRGNERECHRLHGFDAVDFVVHGAALQPGISRGVQHIRFLRPFHSSHDRTRTLQRPSSEPSRTHVVHSILNTMTGRKASISSRRFSNTSARWVQCVETHTGSNSGNCSVAPLPDHAEVCSMLQATLQQNSPARPPSKTQFSGVAHLTPAPELPPRPIAW